MISELLYGTKMLSSLIFLGSNTRTAYSIWNFYLVAKNMPLRKVEGK